VTLSTIRQTSLVHSARTPMSDTAWVLNGVDPAARRQAVDAAARRGVSLADHLTDIVLQNELAEQLRSQAVASEFDAETDFRASAEAPVGAGASRRRAPEKRLSASVGSIDEALRALDSTLFDLNARLGDVEALAGGNARGFVQALQELNAKLAALRVQLEDAERASTTAGQSNHATHIELANACGELEQRLAGVERLARSAETVGVLLGEQQEALRQAVANDLDALAGQATDRLGEGLASARAAADAAARHADASAAHIVNELRAACAAIDARLEESAGETKALRVQLEDAEKAANLSGQSNEAAHVLLADACGELEHRIDMVEALARGAEGAAASLAVQQENLRQAVSDDLGDLSDQTSKRLGEGLQNVRAAAEDAARHADAAAAHVVSELRTLREAIDARLEASASETKGRMQAAFVEAADRMAALANSVRDVGRAQARSTEQLRGEIANAEDAAQAALEETAEGLRRADAQLAAELTRARDAAKVGLDSVRGALAEETDAMRERHLAALTRLAQVEAALASANDETEELRNSLAIRIAALSAGARDGLAQAESNWRARFEDLAARVSDGDDRLEEARRLLGADTERVEACTLAALEKLNADRVGGDAALARDLDGAFTAARASIADARQTFETNAAALRGQHAGLQARLDVVDTALGAIAPLHVAVAEIPALRAMGPRLQKLESAATALPVLSAAIDAIPPLQAELKRLEGAILDRRLESELAGRVTKVEHAVASVQDDDSNQRLRAQLEVLATELAAQQKDTPAAIAALRAQISVQSSALAAQGQRLAAQESAAASAGGDLQNLARLLKGLSTQSAEVETQAQERLHRLEVGLADLRHNQLATADHADKASIETIAIINARIADMESRSAAALEDLHAQIAAFVGDNERRLAAIELADPPALPEQPFAHIEARLDELELRDLGGEFIELRRRIDDRILGLEQRSISALERVCDSVAAIEQRLLHEETERDTRTA
jgi:hypothetical protein